MSLFIAKIWAEKLSNWQPIANNAVHRMVEPGQTIQHIMSQTRVHATMNDTVAGYVQIIYIKYVLLEQKWRHSIRASGLRIGGQEDDVCRLTGQSSGCLWCPDDLTDLEVRQEGQVQVESVSLAATDAAFRWHDRSAAGNLSSQSVVFSNLTEWDAGKKCKKVLYSTTIAHQRRCRHIQSQRTA